MELIQVELKKSKYFAYLFDGKEESAKEFCRKFSLHYQNDFMDKDLFSITLPTGKRAYKGNYIIIDGMNFMSYNREELMSNFNIITDYRQSGYSFMTED